jgi:hypothetical protein
VKLHLIFLRDIGQYRYAIGGEEALVPTALLYVTMARTEVDGRSREAP